MSQSNDNNPEKTSVRLDRWLWSARIFKTRSIAVQAIKNGRVLLNGERPKASKSVSVDDQLTIRRDAFRYDVTVTGLAERRVSATLAKELYQESDESIAARARLKEQLRDSAVQHTPGRPTKRERRDLDRVRRR